MSNIKLLENPSRKTLVQFTKAFQYDITSTHNNINIRQCCSQTLQIEIQIKWIY